MTTIRELFDSWSATEAPITFEGGQLKSGGKDFFQNEATAGPMKRKLAALVAKSTGVPVAGTAVRLLGQDGDKYKVAFDVNLANGSRLHWEIAYTPIELVQSAAIWVHGPDPGLWDGVAAASLMSAALPAGAALLVEQGTIAVAAVGLKTVALRAAVGAGTSVVINEGLSRILGKTPDWRDRAVTAGIGAIAGPIAPTPSLSLMQAVAERRAGDYVLQALGRGVTIYGPIGAAGSVVSGALHPEWGTGPEVLMREAAAGYVGGATIGPALEIGFYGAAAIGRDLARFSGPRWQPVWGSEVGGVPEVKEGPSVYFSVGIPHDAVWIQSVEIMFDDLISFAEEFDNSLLSKLQIWKSQFSGKRIEVALFYDTEGQFHIEPKGVGIKPYVPTLEKTRLKWIDFFREKGAEIPQNPTMKPVPIVARGIQRERFRLHASDPSKIINHLDTHVPEFCNEPHAESSIALSDVISGMENGTQIKTKLPNSLEVEVIKGEKGDVTVFLMLAVAG